MPKLITVAEFARLASLPRASAYAHIAEGRVPGCVRLGKSIRVPADAVDKLLAAAAKNGAKP